ncbi:MAG: hypothetical protein M0T84_07175 [Betaproteobacteria bacterium]|nr:hypothetical protein [Betaproteobacteria bacterium]
MVTEHDAGKVLNALLTQIPPQQISAYCLKAAIAADDSELANCMFHLARTPAAATDEMQRCVAMYMSYTPLKFIPEGY